MDRDLDRLARLAGLLYLVVALAGPFNLIYVPGATTVPGDASATVAKLLAHQDLVRASITVGVISQVCFVGSVLLLYRILRDVGPMLAVAMAALILLQAPLGVLSLANDAATLALARQPELFSAFDAAQRDVLTLLMLKVDKAGTVVSQVFWGLWLLPLGTLVWRSGSFPRWLGGWLVINGLAYLLLSALALWWPDSSRQAFAYATPAMLGELALALWMLVRGTSAGPADRGGVPLDGAGRADAR